MNYHQEYQASIDNPEAFWQDKALHLDWFTPPKKSTKRKYKRLSSVV